MIKTFSCGRGIHKVFKFQGLFPVESGYLILRRQGSRLNYVVVVDSLDLKPLKGLARLWALLKYFNHKNSLYFGETTDLTKEYFK